MRELFMRNVACEDFTCAADPETNDISAKQDATGETPIKSVYDG